MALFRTLQESIYQKAVGVLKIYPSFFRNSSDFARKVLEDVQKSRKQDDMPVEIKNPFAEGKPQCILCKHNIEPNFKNVRLLSQFVSSYTGRVYGRHITGLCVHKQQQVETAIKKAQVCGLMGYYVKNPNFLADPDLYDSTKPFRVF